MDALLERTREAERQRDRRTALICYTVAASQGNKDVTIETFMPMTDAERDERNWRALLAAMEAMAGRSDQGSN